MSNKESHQVTITIEGTREMLESFLQAYEKASDLYDWEMYTKDKESWLAEQKLLRSQNIEAISILHNYHSGFYWQIHNHFTRLDRKLLTELEKQPVNTIRDSKINEVKARLERTL